MSQIDRCSLRDPAKALQPCSAISQDHSVVLSKLHKHLVRQIEKLDVVVSKHTRAVKVSVIVLRSSVDDSWLVLLLLWLTEQKEYNALDEVIMINDKRMSAAGDPIFFSPNERFHIVKVKAEHLCDSVATQTNLSVRNRPYRLGLVQHMKSTSRLYLGWLTILPKRNGR